MKKIVIVLVLAFLVSGAAFAQIIKGKCFDALTKEPIEGVTLQINSNHGVISGSNGSFSLDLQGASILHISFMGYESQRLENLTQGNFLWIALTSKIEDLQGITVTASREAAQRLSSPVAIHKLSPTLVDETKPIGVSELINKTPGVLMVNLNNEQHSMAIRQPATTSPYYLYLEDGIAVRPLGIFNHNALLETNQLAISSVEVVKGPVSSIYGSEGIGGAINFLTHRPTAVPTLKFGLMGDNWGYTRYQLSGGATIGKFGFYLAGLHSFQNDSWRTRSDYRKEIFNVRLEYSFSSKTRLIGTGIIGDYYSETSGNVDSTGFYGRSYPANNDFTFRDVFAVRNRLTLEQDWNSASKSFVTVFHRINRNGQNPSYRLQWNAKVNPVQGKGEFNSSDFKSSGLIAQHSQRLSWKSTKILGGISLDNSPVTYSAHQVDLNVKLRPGGKSVEFFTIDQLRPDIQLSGYSATINNLGTYVQVEVSPVEKLQFTLGGRYDRMGFDYSNQLDQSSGTRSYSQFTPKLGLTWEIKSTQGVYANYSQGFSPPQLTSIFRPRPGSDPATFYYNLEPALFDSKELGYWGSFWNNKLYVDFTIYQMTGKNELLSIRQPDNAFDYQSAGKTLHYGSEFSLTLKPSPGWFIRTGGTWAKHEFADFQISQGVSDQVQNLSGKEMPGAPRWISNSEATYYPAFVPKLRTSLELQLVTGYYENQINTKKTEGYQVFNFRTGYKFKWLEIFGNVLNLSNTLYAHTVSRGNNAEDKSNYTPAAPRTFILGVQFNLEGKTQKP